MVNQQTANGIPIFSGIMLCCCDSASLHFEETY